MAIPELAVGARIVAPLAVAGWKKAGSPLTPFIGPGWLLEHQVRINRKDGSTKMPHDTPARLAAGIDVSKRKLDVAITGSLERFTAPNDAAGHAVIAERLQSLGIQRVGLEASGHYEAAVVQHLRQRDFVVLVLDPGQVHGWRRFQKRRAKTDPIDAALIAEVTAAVDLPRQAPDPRLAPLAEHLTLIEQLAEDIARLKTRLERYSEAAPLRFLKAEIQRLTKCRARQLARLIGLLRAAPDLARRFDILLSIPGVGEITAATFVIRMPELGRLSRAEAAALVGVAPFNADSGEQAGQRHIAGGRSRLRRAVFLAAFAAAQQWNPLLQATYRRLRDAGKHHTVATVACTRKLVAIANALIARGQPWQPEPPVRHGAF
jgi:transposase